MLQLVHSALHSKKVGERRRRSEIFGRTLTMTNALVFTPSLLNRCVDPSVDTTQVHAGNQPLLVVLARVKRSPDISTGLNLASLMRSIRDPEVSMPMKRITVTDRPPEEKLRPINCNDRLPRSRSPRRLRPRGFVCMPAAYAAISTSRHPGWPPDSRYL